MRYLPKTFGLDGKIGGFEAVPGLGVETCLLVGTLLAAPKATEAMVEAVFEAEARKSSPMLFRLGLPGQLTSIKGSLMGTLELLDVVEDGGETREPASYNLWQP